MKQGAREIFFRVDAGEFFGSGHVMRCLALAQAWKRLGGNVIFGVAQGIDVIVDRLVSEGMQVLQIPCGVEREGEDAGFVKRFVSRRRDLFAVVVDGYHFGARYIKIVKETGKKVLCIDDYGHASQYVADWILNQNIYAMENFYAAREPGTTLLLGLEYALLREEFVLKRKKDCNSAIVKNILVTFGGSDPDNVTLRVMKALIPFCSMGVKIQVIVGPSNPNKKHLEKFVSGLEATYTLVSAVNDMASFMNRADLAICAGGTTCWELAYFGVPFVTIPLDENQEKGCSWLAKKGVACNLGCHGGVSKEKIFLSVEQLMADRKKRKKMRHLGRYLVDGQGANRVAKLLMQGKDYP